MPNELRIKLNPEKTKVIIFSRPPLSRNSEPILKLYGERLKICPQVKFLGNVLDSRFTFQKHFEEILGSCNTRYHRIRLLVNKIEDPARSSYYKFTNNAFGQFSNMAPFRHNNIGHDYQQNSTASEQIYLACPVFTKIH